MSIVYGYQGGSSVGLFNLTAGIRAAYSWNPSSIEPFVRVDLGPSLLSAPTTIIDHGSVTQQEAFGLEDWGRIIYTETNFPFGEFRPVSNTTWTVVHAWVGSGQIFERGNTYYRLVAPWIVSGTLIVSGNAETHWVPNIESTGLFGIQSNTDEAFSRIISGSGTLFKFGSVSSTSSRAYSTGGLFKLSSNTRISFQPNWVGDGSLALYNESIEVTRVFGYAGTGTLSTLDTNVERRTYSYNLSSIVYFDYLDFGTIPLQTIQNIQTNQTLSGSSTGSTVAIDPGVTASVTSDYQVSLPNGTPNITREYIPITLGRSAGEDWGFININQTLYPMGLARLKSETKIAFSPNWVGFGNIEITGIGIGKTNPIWSGYGVLNVSGFTIPNFSLAHYGSGSLFNIGGGDSVKTNSYVGSGILFNFVSSVEKSSKDYEGSGSLFNLQTESRINFIPNWVSYGEIGISGQVSDVKRSFSQDDIANLFVLSGDAYHERRTYSYNDSSIVFFEYEDYEFISSIGSVLSVTNSQNLSGISTDSIIRIEDGVTATVDLLYQISLVVGSVPDVVLDHGFITEGYSGNIDWGFISQTITNYPFGGFRYVSDSKTNFAIGNLGSGDISIFGEGRGRTNPIWNSYIRIQIDINSEKSRTKVYTGSGLLFNFVRSDESIANTYTGSGSLFAISGLAESVGFAEIKDVLFDISGTASIRFAPNWNGFGDIKVDGFADNIQRTFSHSKQGSLYVISGDAYHERRTYSYNDSSIVFFEYENFGFIAGVGSLLSVSTSQILSGQSDDSIVRIENGVTASVDLQYQVSLIENSIPDQFFDYGSITEGYSGNIDWGFISQTITNYPFGGFHYNSSTLTNFSIGNLGSGQLSIFGEGKARVNPQWFAFIQIETNGESENALTKVFTGSGKLFEFVSSDESRTYSYSASGTLFGIGGSVESVSFSPEEQQILFKFVGTSKEAFVPNWNGLAETKISGFADPILRSFGYQTTGSLFVFDAFVERRTYAYNDSSVNYYRYRDYESLPAGGQITDIVVNQEISGTAPTSIIRVGSSGLDVVAVVSDGSTYTIDPTIGSITEETIDCGFILSENNERTVREDYGFTSYRSALSSKITEYPFGSIGNFAGSFVFTPFSIANVVGGDIFVSGEVTVRLTPRWTGEGTLFAFAGSAESVGFNTPENIPLFKFVGSAEERITSTEISESGIISITGSVNISVLTDILRDVHLEISGSASEAFTPNWNGSGTLFNIGQSVESITIRIPAFQADLILVGSAQIRSTRVETFTADIDVFGSAVERQSDAYVGYSIVDVFNETAGLLRTRSFTADGRLYSFSGAAESFTVNPQEDTALFSFAGEKQERRTVSPKGFGSFQIFGTTAPEILTFAEQPVGLISVFGQANVVNLDVYLADGNLFAIGQSSEAITIKIPAFQADIEIKGASTRSRTFGGNIGFRHILLSGTSGEQLLTFAEQPTVFVDVTGQANILRAHSYKGDIFIGHFGRSAESITRRLPAFTADITFRPEKATLSATYREISRGGTLKVSGEIRQPKLTFAEQPTVFIDVLGIAETPRSRTYTGNIFIGHFGGAAESISIKLPEFQSDIVFRPTAAGIKSTSNWIGSGSIQISGTPSQVIFIPNYTGFGTLALSSLTTFKFAKTYIGLGQIFSIGGSAESITYNPEEKQALFSFGGTKVEKVTFNPPEEGVLLSTFGTVFEKFTPNNIGSGLITLDITTRYAQIVKYIGEGQIFAIAGAAESITINPDESVALFSFAGSSINRISKSYVGFGSLFVFDGSAESIAVTVKSEGLFEISGFATERISIRESGFGVLFNFVTSEQRRTFSWTSKDIQIDLSGVAIEKQTDSYFGFGSIFSIGGVGITAAFSPESEVDIHVFGAARSQRSRNYIGSGNLFTFDSATESRTITYENVAIFNFLGVARQRVARRLVVDVNVEIRGSAQESFIRSVYRGSADTQITGESIERISNVIISDVSIAVFNKEVTPTLIKSFVVTGQQKLFGDAYITRSFGYDGYAPLEIDINTKIIAPYQAFRSEGGVIATIGIARTKRVQVSPSRSYGWII